MSLTGKEIEVLKLRIKGLKQSEVAKKLKISQPAVSLFEKNTKRKISEAKEILQLIKNIK